MRIKYTTILKLPLFIVTAVCCFSCQDMTDDTYVTQSYMDNYLYTGAKFKGEDIWHTYDEINLQTSDSIKIVRYEEAQKWINMFKSVDSLK